MKNVQWLLWQAIIRRFFSKVEIPMLKSVTTAEVKLLKLLPYSYHIDKLPVKELIIRRGWRRWNNIYMFNYKNEKITIDIMHTSPLKINFKPAFLKIYTEVEKLKEDLRDYLMKIEFIRAILEEGEEINVKKAGRESVKSFFSQDII